MVYEDLSTSIVNLKFANLCTGVSKQIFATTKMTVISNLMHFLINKQKLHFDLTGYMNINSRSYNLIIYIFFGSEFITECI